MNKKKVLQTMFALSSAVILTTGCSNEMNLQGEQPQGSGETSVSFTLGLPQGEEVGYTRADRNDDATEWAIKTLKAYHFSTTTTPSPTDADYTLVAAYNVPVKTTLATGETGMGVCKLTADAAYQLKLSLRSATGVSNEKHAFAFIANDSCATFDEALEKGVTTLAALKACIADKKLKDSNTMNSTLFMGDPAGLCMTGEVKDKTLQSGDNAIGSVDMTRIMARMDVQNFVPESRNFKLLSVRLKYNNVWGAPQGYLFAEQTANIWTTTEAMEITQNPQYTENGYQPYGTSGYLDEAWVGLATLDNRQGTWYKKVLYMYPYPKELNGNPLPTPTAEVTYTLNGWTSTTEVALNDVRTGNPFEIKRNYLYTLQVGETSAIGGQLTFTFTDTPWTLHEIDADLNEGK